LAAATSSGIRQVSGAFSDDFGATDWLPSSARNTQTYLSSLGNELGRFANHVFGVSSFAVSSLILLMVCCAVWQTWAVSAVVALAATTWSRFPSWELTIHCADRQCYDAFFSPKSLW